MEKIRANLILEILGRPKEHVLEALNELVKKLGSEKGTRIIEKKNHEPILVQDSKDLFTSFSEILAEFDSLDNYFGIIFAYMPSNIEIINPERLVLNNSDLNQLANKLVQRLHNYDAITKKSLYENEILVKKLKEINSTNPGKHIKEEKPKLERQSKKKKSSKNSG